jgi:thiamine-monophosphate kinase
MIDTSDGFLGDLGHICKESGAGALLMHEKLPVSDDLRKFATDFGMDPYEIFLKDSDDYELIITCPSGNVDQIKATVSAISNVPVNDVGRMTHASEGLKMMLPDGKQHEIVPAGWDHFSK